MNMKRTTMAMLVMVVLAMAVWLFGASNAAHAKFTCSTEPVVAEAFDTIWQIATDNCEGNLQNAVHHMIQLNDGSAILQIGQTVQIPVENS
tara:strand:- start:778 stop:1050 length:273 start_codon:yes stop_codon:yes gene_type:complete